MQYETIAITGGAGFIGSNFARHILARFPERSIKIIDNFSYPAQSKTEIQAIGRNLVVHDIDITLANRLRPALEDCDVVVHFAAQTHVDRSLINPYPFLASNVIGTQTLLDCIQASNVRRLIHISTDEVYGPCLDPSRPFQEHARLFPRNPYAATKAGAEHLVQAAIAASDLEAVIVRPGNTYGPWQYPEKIVPLFITNAMLDKMLPVYGDGSAKRNYLHVKDLCYAIELLIQKGMPGEAYNVCSKQTYSALEVANLISEYVTGSGNLVTNVSDRIGHDPSYHVDTEKISTLGWHPEYFFKTALKDLVKWYATNRDWWSNVRKQRAFLQYYERRYGQTGIETLSTDSAM